MSLQTRFSTATSATRFHTFSNLIRSCGRVTNFAYFCQRSNVRLWQLVSGISVVIKQKTVGNTEWRFQSVRGTYKKFEKNSCLLKRDQNRRDTRIGERQVLATSVLPSFPHNITTNFSSSFWANSPKCEQEDWRLWIFPFFKTTIRTFLLEIEKVSDEDIDSVLSDKNQDEVLEKHCQYLGST